MGARRGAGNQELEPRVAVSAPSQRTDIKYIDRTEKKLPKKLAQGRKNLRGEIESEQRQGDRVGAPAVWMTRNCAAISKKVALVKGHYAKGSMCRADRG